MKPTTIEAYIKDAPEELHERLWKLHACIQKAAPGAKEEIKWSVPAYSYKRILVTFAVFKNHTGFYPTPPVIQRFAKELEAYKTGESSVQFPHKEKLPLTLISKMVKCRVQEAELGDAKWKS